MYIKKALFLKNRFLSPPLERLLYLDRYTRMEIGGFFLSLDGFPVFLLFLSFLPPFLRDIFTQLHFFKYFGRKKKLPVSTWWMESVILHDDAGGT